MEPGSSQWCQEKRQQAKTEIHEIPPKHKKNLLAVKVDEQGNRVPGEVVEFPSLEKFKRYWDVIQLVLLRAGGLD